MDVFLVTNTWDIVMAIFDVAQNVVSQSVGIISSSTSIDLSTAIPDMEAQLEAMDLGPLLGLWFQSMVVGLTMNILSICIFLVVYGRMIEIYLVTSVGPIPFATMSNREWSGVGQNYLKSLIALGFQAFLIMICVGIYAVLIQEISTADNISAAIWGCMGYTVLLCFTLFISLRHISPTRRPMTAESVTMPEPGFTFRQMRRKSPLPLQRLGCRPPPRRICISLMIMCRMCRGSGSLSPCMPMWMIWQCWHRNSPICPTMSLKSCWLSRKHPCG